MKTSPTQRSLKHLRELGYHADVVEKTIPHCFIKRDLWNWVDIMAVSPKLGILGVQTTTKGNMGARLEKARGNAALMAFIIAGGFLDCHGWRKLKGHWVLDVKRITLDDLIEKEAIEP